MQNLSELVNTENFGDQSGATARELLRAEGIPCKAAILRSSSTQAEASRARRAS